MFTLQFSCSGRLVRMRHFCALVALGADKFVVLKATLVLAAATTLAVDRFRQNTRHQAIVPGLIINAHAVVTSKQQPTPAPVEGRLSQAIPFAGLRIAALQFTQLLLEFCVGNGAEGSNGRQAQSAPGQGANQQQLQQMPGAIDRMAA